jgi:predicted permease
MTLVPEPSWRRYLTFWRSTVDRDVDTELRFHFEERLADLMACGMPPADARAQAEEEFGDRTLYRERLKEIDRRMEGRRRRTRWREVLAADIRYALRGMRRSPSLAFTVVVVLALGVGANATMFGLIDRLLLQAPPHISDPDRVVLLHVGRPADSWVQISQPYVFKTVMEQAVPDFSGVAVATPTGVVRRTYYPVGRGVTAARAAGALVSNNYFSVLGVRPALGRLFTPTADTATIPERVAVLGYGYWQRQYGGQREALGQQIELGTESFTIIGVLPPGFTGTEMRDVDVWLPVNAAPGFRFARETDWKTSSNSQWLLVVARLRPGVDVRHAEAQATLALRNWRRSLLSQVTPARLARIDSSQVTFSSMIPGKSKWEWGLSGSGGDVKITMLLAGASGMLLLIACANIANLLLVRSLSRRREIAVRLSLGVTRARLISQFLVEGLTLTGFGIIGALAATAIGSQFVRRWLIGEGAFSAGVVDSRVLAFTIAVGLLTGLAASMLPALHSSRADLSVALKSGSRFDASRGTRLRNGLLVAQGAIAVILLAGAGLFLRSVRNAKAIDVGLDPDRVIMARIDQGVTGLGPEAMRSLFDEFVRRAKALPGVRAAAIATPVPFAGSWSTSLSIPGRTLSDDQGSTFQYYVTPEYFDVMGVRLIAGRTLSESGSPELVINEALARRFWSRTSAIGQCMKLDADTMPCATIVGVVSNTHRQDLVEEQAVPQVYRPIPRAGVAAFQGYTLVTRTDGEAVRLVEPLRRAIQSAGPFVPYADVQTIRQRMGSQSRKWDLGARVFGAFATLALVLAAVGLFSVVAFTVGQRMYEFGVRTALGARPRDLARLTVVRGMAPALGGIVLGLVLVFVLGRFLDGLLFQESTRDPIALAAATAVLLVSAALASAIPAMRASRADPRTALNAE